VQREGVQIGAERGAALVHGGECLAELEETLHVQLHLDCGTCGTRGGDATARQTRGRGDARERRRKGEETRHVREKREKEKRE